MVNLLSHLPLLVSLHYLVKNEPRNLVFSVMLYTENNTGVYQTDRQTHDDGIYRA